MCNNNLLLNTEVHFNSKYNTIVEKIDQNIFICQQN